MPLPTRKIGQHDVSAIGYGAMGIAAFYAKPPEDEERLKVLEAAYESGCTMWDTADAYADSEELIGKWFKRTGKRNEIFLATKFGLAASKPGRAVCCDPEYVHQAFEKSIHRLEVEYIDLYYMHRVDISVPIEKTVAAMAELVRAGKVKYLGLSECSANTLRRAHAVYPISALQVEYSPFTIDIEQNNLLKTARELGVTIVAYSPIGRGMLTGRYRSIDDLEETDGRRGLPRFSKENYPLILKIADELKSIGARHDATAAQVSLAWVLGQGPDILPIPGTSNVVRLKENLAAALVDLTPDELEEVRKIAESAKYGNAPRYSPVHASLVGLDTPPPA